MSRYVVGIDVGTESVRSGVFDESGRCRGFGVAPIATTRPGPGRAEQSVPDWEAGLASAVRGALSASGVDAAAIEAVAADGTTSTVVALGADRRPVRPPLLWMDVRAHREAAEIAAVDDPALAYVGGSAVSAEWFPCKLLWLKRHEPEAYRRAAIFFELTDWLLWWLSDEIATSVSAASMRWFYNDERGGVPGSLYRAIGLADALDRLPARAVDAGHHCGGLSRRAAEATGLPAGIPVAGGGADAPMGALGMGVDAPGRLALITGSSHVHFAHLDHEVHAPGLFGSYPNGLIRGYHLLEGGQVSTGSVIRWFADRFASASIEREAKARGVSTLELLGERAAAVPVGAEGLLVLEHFQGNRTPWADPTSRGVIRGLSLSHGPEHIFRAIMESVAVGSAIIVRRMAQAGVDIQEIVACGGTTQSELWTKIHANAMGKPVSIPEEQQAPVLGSAMAAAVAAGIHPDLPTAARAMSRTARIVEPDRSLVEHYEFLIDRYEETYRLLADSSRALVEWSEAHGE